MLLWVSSERFCRKNNCGTSRSECRTSLPVGERTVAVFLERFYRKNSGTFCEAKIFLSF